MPEVVMEIKSLNKSFGENHVLKNFSLSVRKGENLAVLGKSGSGKSVLIKCIIGLIQPDSGSIMVFNQEIAVKLRGGKVTISSVPSSFSK